MTEKYRLVPVDLVTLRSLRTALSAGFGVTHYADAPANRKYLVRCTIEGKRKHFRVVAVSSADGWRIVSHYDRIFVK